MGLAAMMANIMSQDKIFAGDKQRSGMAFNPDYKPARETTIHLLISMTWR